MALRKCKPADAAVTLNVDARFCLATSIEQLTSKRGLDSLRIEILSSNSNLLRDLTVELQSRPLNLKCG